MVSVFAKAHQIKIPENLKYLVHQDRISRNVKEFSSHLSLFQSRQQLNTIKTPRFVPSRVSLRDQGVKTPKVQSKESSMCNLMSTLRITIGPDLRYMTSRSINHNKSADCSMRQDDNSWTQFQTRRKFRDSCADKEQSVSSHHSRCKSQSYENIKGIQNKRSKRQTETTGSIEQAKPVKRFSAFSMHSKTGGSYIDKFKKSDNSLAQVQTAKKLIHKSFNQMGSDNLVGSLTPCQENYGGAFVFRQDQPTKQKIPINIISPLQSADPTFHVIPEPQEVIKANQWTTTLTNLLSSSSSKLNTSITEGQDTSSYLQDVRLQRLQNISKQMVVSLIPQGSEKMVDSEQLIQ